MKKLLLLTRIGIVCSMFLLLPAYTSFVSAQNTKIVSTCNDGIDNDGDGKIDYAGAYIDEKFYEPDPSCLRKDSKEVADVSGGGLVPCNNKCSFTDVFRLLNNVLKFLITVVIIPIFVITLMYTGYQYLMAQGNSGMHAKLKSRVWKMFLGFVIILCAWLIVRTFLSLIGYEEGALFLE